LFLIAAALLSVKLNGAGVPPLKWEDYLPLVRTVNRGAEGGAANLLMLPPLV
jgi:hypothetical protein